MANNVDKRVVEMQFDNAQFEQGVKTSTESLEKLKKGLDFSGITGKKGMDLAKSLDMTGTVADVEKTANAFQRFKSHVPDVMKTAGKAMVAFGATGVAAIGGVTTALGSMALKGGITRAMNLKQADFMLQGLVKDEKAVAAIMDNVQASVDGTAYSLDQAALVASQFAATGMRGGKEMENALKGVSGAAAVFGADYQRIGQIFTQISGQGRVMGNDLLQLSSYGMNAAATLADYFKNVKGEANMTEAEIRDMVSKGKIDFQTFAEAMNWAFGEQAAKANETFTGALSNVKSALSRIGEKVASPAIDALRDFFNTVRPLINELNTFLTPSLEKFGEKITALSKKFSDLGASGKASLKDVFSFDAWNGSNSFYIIADYLKGVSDGSIKASEDVTKFAKKLDKQGKLTKEGIRELVKDGEISFGIWESALNKVLGNDIQHDQSSLAILLRSILDILGQVGRVAKSVGNAFSDIFPETATETIREAIVNFSKLTSNFKISEQTLNNVRSTFKGIFTIIKWFGSSLKGAAIIFAPFIKGLVAIAKAAVSISARIGDIIVKIDQLAKKTGIFKTITKVIAFSLNSVVTVFQGFTDAISDIFSAFGEGSFAKHMKSFANIGDEIAKSFGKIKDSLTGKFPQLGGILDNIAEGFKNFGKSVKEAFRVADFSFLTDLVSAGGISAIFITIKNFIDSLSGAFEGSIGMLSSVKEVLNGLRDTFVAYQNTLKAQVLLKIAQAIAILAAAIIALSFVNPKRLIPAVLAIEVLLFSMFKMMDGLSSLGGKGIKGFANIAKIGSLLLTTAVAIGVLAIAVRTIAKLSPEELFTGLIGITAACMILIKAAEKLSADKRKMMKGASSLIVLALAINLLAKAVSTLGSLNPKEIAVGLGSVIVMLAAIAGFMAILTKKGANRLDKSAASILVLAGSLYILAYAVKALSGLSVEELGKGLGSVIVLLAALAAFSNKFSKKGSIKFKAVLAELLVLAGSIYILTEAVKTMASLSLDEIGHGLLGLAGGVAILVTALGAMSGIKGGGKAALSMLVLVVAIKGLAGAMKSLGSMGMDEIGHSLLALAAGLGAMIIALGIMSTMGVKGTVAATSLLIMAAALEVLAPALKLLGSMSLEQIGIALLAVAGAFGVLGLAALILAPVIPEILMLSAAIAAIGIACAAAGAGIALVAVGLSTLAALGPASIDNLVNTITNLAQGIPVIFAAIAEGIVELIRVLGENAIQLAAVGATLIIALLSAINDRMYELVNLGVQIAVNFINGVANNIPLIIDAGINLMAQFINGMANGIRENQEMIFTAVGNLMGAIINFVLSALQILLGEIPVVGDDISAGIETIKGKVDEKLNPKNATDQMQKYAEGYGAGFEKGGKKAKTAADKMSKDVAKSAGKTEQMSKAGEKVGTSYSKKLEKASEKAKAYGKKFPLNAAKGADNTTPFEKAGSKVGDSFNKSVGKKADNAKKKGTELANKVKSGAESVTGFNTAGLNAAQGFVDGASSKGTDAWNAGWSLAGQFESAIKARLREKSPSKVTYKDGYYAIKGFANGVDKNLKLSRNAGYAIAYTMRDALKESSREIKMGVDSLDMVPSNPVIKPVVDLSGVKAASSDINSIFGGTRSISAAADISNSMRNNSMMNEMTKLVDRISKLTKQNASVNPNYFTFNVSGSENPEAFANRVSRQLEMEMRAR